MTVQNTRFVTFRVQTFFYQFMGRINKLLIIPVLFVFLIAYSERCFAVRCQQGDSVAYHFDMDSVSFQELVVMGKRQMLTFCGDTLVFDVSAITMPQSSNLRALLMRLPGIEVTADGRVLAHGEEVIRIKLNGRDFFKDNMDMALENLPAKIMSEVKIYRENTEEEERTGLKRNEGMKVLDVSTEPDMTKGYMTDISTGGGTKNRYQFNASLSRLSSTMQAMLSCNADNQPLTFGIGGSYLDKFTGRANVSDMKNHNYNGIFNCFKGPWEINAAVFFSNGVSESKAKSNTEYYLHDVKSYAFGMETTEAATHSLSSSVDFRYMNDVWEWNTRLQFANTDYANGFYSLSELQEESPKSGVRSVGVIHPLNSSQYTNDTFLDRTGFSFRSSANRKLNCIDGNIEMTVGGDYSMNNEHGMMRSEAYYSNFNIVERKALESYSKKTESNTYLKGIITGLLTEGLKYQFAYTFTGRFNRLDYQAEDLSYDFLSLLPQNHPHRVDSLEKNARLNTVMHDVSGFLQYERGNFRLSAGVTLESQRQNLHYLQYEAFRDTTQYLVSFLPELSFAYSHDDNWNMIFRYSGQRKQPDITGMLPVWDYGNPLSLYVGNVNLQPEFNHAFSASFYRFRPLTQRQLALSLNAAVNQNYITSMVSFDSERGIYKTMPVNVDGNWSAGWQMDFSTSFRNAPRFTLEWKHSVSAQSERGMQHTDISDGIEGGRISKVWTVGAMQYLSLQYAFAPFSVTPYAYGRMTSFRNNMQQSMNSELWHYGAGVLCRADFDFGLSLGMDVYDNYHKGYWESDMNGHEWICDVEASYSFLKNKSLELRLQGCDVLGNLNRINQINTISFKRELVNFKGVNSYFMFSLCFHFGRFPGV